MLQAMIWGIPVAGTEKEDGVHKGTIVSLDAMRATALGGANRLL